MTTRFHCAFFLLFLFVPSLFALDKYERKSISYIDALWLATPQARDVSSQQVNYMLSEIKQRIEMLRFDYNPLPEPLIQDFVDAANARESLTVDDLAQLMEERLTSKIIEIIEESVNVRAGELVSSEKLAGFLATKAKELGITLDEIEKVMNSAYIYLPVLTGLKRKDAEQKDKYIYTITGGIIWYHVDMSSGHPEVRLRISQTSLSKGFGSDKFAYESAVDNFARNLEVATKSMPEFKLSAPIVEVDNGNITFALGIKEGVKLDETFLVGEWVYGVSGEPEFTTDGWVRIGRVGNNLGSKTDRSSAWAVKRGSWAPGMAVIEHPRLPIDVAFKLGAYYSEITTGRIQLLTTSLRIEEDYKTFAPGFDLDAQYNLAAITGVSQLFFLVGGHFAFPATLELTSPDTWVVLTAAPPYIWGIHAGLAKKIYAGQLAYSFGGKIGVRYFTVEQSLELSGTEYTYTISNNTLGVHFETGVEYAATPDVNFGALIGYQLFPVSEIWTQELDPLLDGAIYSWDDRFPDINLSGVSFSFYVHYTPPALTIDPVSWLRGAMGE